MEAFDFAGRTKLPRGPHVARGPQVGKPCYIEFQVILTYNAKSLELKVNNMSAAQRKNEWTITLKNMLNW